MPSLDSSPLCSASLRCAKAFELQEGRRASEDRKETGNRSYIFRLYRRTPIIYAPFQEQGFGLDMRYFLPLYIPLLFFTLASIRDVLMFEGRIERAFAAAWIIFTGLVLVYIALFALKTSNLISSLSFPFIGTLGVITAALMVLFVPYFVGYRKGVKELAILVGFATFVSSYWLIFASLVWQKTPIGVPRPGMILPIMEVIHRVIMVAIGS